MLKEKIRAQILGGSLTNHKKYLAGLYKGYYITMNPVNNQYVISINVSSSNDEANNNLKTYLLRQKETIKQLANIIVYPHSAELVIQSPGLLKNLPDTINAIIDPIINYLISGQYVSGCAECGTSADQISCYEINDAPHYICHGCSQNIEESLCAQQQDILSRKSNFPAGLVGAFLGSLIGCILWVLIYKLGYIAGIAGAVTGICAMKGYELLGKRLDKKGVIGSVIVMIIMIYFANKFAWSWDAYSVFKEYGATFSECFRSIGDIIAESDLTGSYITDLLIGYALTALASFGTIKNALKASTGNYTMKKI